MRLLEIIVYAILGASSMSKPSRAPKHDHEVRDPVHVFIHFDSDERKVIDSRPLQRLRHIHQLALTYLIYPSATHKRFEHSLGVMEVASKIFDVVTREQNISEDVKKALPEIAQPKKLMYWRSALRMAALCHDTGHLPFSHAAEEKLLPVRWDHERLTRELILSDEMASIWRGMTPPLRAEDIVKLAIGPRKASDLTFSNWEAILSEIIVGDTFGADRIDYLLRDSHHAGVSYGRFDHHRLLETLRIVPSPTSVEPALGAELGGIQSAEALLIARYLIYSQVYLHRVRRIYDIHLCDFLSEWLDCGKFATDVPGHLAMTDNEVTTAFQAAALDSSKTGHVAARRLAFREHFKVLYERNPENLSRNPRSGTAIFQACKEKFGADSFRHDSYIQKGAAYDFPVLWTDGSSVSSLALSKTLGAIPLVAIEYVFVCREKQHEVEKWLGENKATIIEKGKVVEDEEI